MKKIISTGFLALIAIICANAQSLPSMNEIKKEVQTEVKTEEKLVKTVVTTVVTTEIKTSATANNVASVAKLIALIKTKVPITADQESKILGVVSKINFSKSTTPKDQLKSLLGIVDFTKIFSSAQVAKLKSLFVKK